MPVKSDISIINPQLTLDWIISHSTGKGVEVAVIDSGVDASHPELQGKVKRACVVRESEPGKIRCDDMPPQDAHDSFGHGTAVAGIITAMAPDVEIISVKVLNEYNSCTGDILIQGIRWALDQNIRLINMSLATSKDRYIPAIFRLCERAYTQNTIVVASRRNFGPMGYPAMFSSVIGVDATDFKDQYALRFRPRHLIEYDARGEKIKVPAPGGGHAMQSGSSFATPHVTGMVALLLEALPDLLPIEAKMILKSMSMTRVQ
jgi:subtilisin family serine protease